MTQEMKFLATSEKVEVSAQLVRPESATHLLVFGHGASTNMRHATLQSIAERLAEVGIATFRYNFPYSENGKGRDGQEVCMETIRSAIAAAHRAAPDLPLLAGGHSFSGRMTSTAASESPLDSVIGLVFFSFPLHLAGKPEMKRADHLADVTVPMLFLSGSRDELAEMDLLKPVCEKLGKLATLHVLDTADHG
jgi:predicted alpha/beta-hydrolase family hydrolase